MRKKGKIKNYHAFKLSRVILFAKSKRETLYYNRVLGSNYGTFSKRRV